MPQAVPVQLLQRRITWLKTKSQADFPTRTRQSSLSGQQVSFGCAPESPCRLGSQCTPLSLMYTCQNFSNFVGAKALHSSKLTKRAGQATHAALSSATFKAVRQAGWWAWAWPAATCQARKYPFCCTPLFPGLDGPQGSVTSNALGVGMASRNLLSLSGSSSDGGVLGALQRRCVRESSGRVDPALAAAADCIPMACKFPSH
eukprot:scaffold55128_cov17-Tisochrysis_lutea.AAC.1